jgi:hypothetical protein
METGREALAAARHCHRPVREHRSLIPLGCSLSPLMGALYLDGLDRHMEATGLFYARFMDDWVVLAPTRWKLRTAIRRINQTLAELQVKQHPGKTFVGRISRGFEFLGYSFASAGLVGVARQSVERFVDRATQLYEQGADSVRIGEYVRRWRMWVRSGLNVCVWNSIRSKAPCVRSDENKVAVLVHRVVHPDHCVAAS